MHANRTRRAKCLTFAGMTIVAGLTWRLVPLGLPPFWFKYGGSALWAVMVYWLVATLFPRWRSAEVAAAACGVAAMVELSRLLHTPGADVFRASLAGRLLLGRFFSIWDIVAYWLAIGAVAALDHFALKNDATNGQRAGSSCGAPGPFANSR